jgi:hypothetical protein
MDDLTQVAALPLGSHLKIDAWDDKVYPLNSKAETILNPGDKMPLELTPVYFRLQRYQAAAAAPATANTPVPQTQPQQTQPQAAASDGSNAQPAASDGSNTQPPAQPQQNPQ